MSEEKADNLESEALKVLDEQIITVEEIKNKIDDIVDVAEKKHKTAHQESIKCECGGRYVPRNKTRHIKSSKHILYLTKNPISEALDIGVTTS
jgi:uncharacterized protein YllA (UPF0747 family)